MAICEGAGKTLCTNQLQGRTAYSWLGLASLERSSSRVELYFDEIFRKLIEGLLEQQQRGPCVFSRLLLLSLLVKTYFLPCNMGMFLCIWNRGNAQTFRAYSIECS